MKAQFKNPINSFAPVFLMLLAIFLLGVGCDTSKPTPDPLAGFHAAYGKVDQSIINDYQTYIQNLSSDEKKFIAYTEFFEDGTGQHAVKITIGLNHTDWEHVLIYDKSNKRIKTVKYVSGHSTC